MSEVKIEPIVSGSQADEFVELSMSEYGSKAQVSTHHYFTNKFLTNPAGESVVVSINLNQRCIGRLVLVPRIFFWNSKKIRCCYPSEFLIQKDQRGLDRALQLLSGFKKTARHYMFALVVPNKNSTEIWRKLSGLRSNAKLAVMAAPLNPLKLLLNLANSCILRAISSSIDYFYSRIFNSLSHLVTCFSAYNCKVCNVGDLPYSDIESYFENHEIRGDRSHPIMTWRTSFRADTSYIFLLVKRKKIIVGYGVFAEPEDYNGLKPLILLDIASEPKDRECVLKALGRWGIVHGCRRGSDVVLFMGVIPNQKFGFFSHLPFMSVPGRFLPDANSVFFDFIKSTEDEKSLYLTLFDCDVF